MIHARPARALGARYFHAHAALLRTVADEIGAFLATGRRRATDESRDGGPPNDAEPEGAVVDRAGPACSRNRGIDHCCLRGCRADRPGVTILRRFGVRVMRCYRCGPSGSEG